MSSRIGRSDCFEHGLDRVRMMAGPCAPLAAPSAKKEVTMRVRPCSAVALGGLLHLLGGCGGDGGSADAGNTPVCTISGVSVAGSASTVTAGDTVDLTATVTQASGSSGCNGGVVWAANPSGAQISPSGLAATFSASSANVYTVFATSKDDISKAGMFQITVQPKPTSCGTPNGTVVTHSGNITADETWAGNGVTHSITSSVRIKAPATVTIQACAIVSLVANAEIGVQGDTTGNRPARLVAAGTDDQTGFVSFLPAVDGQFWGPLHGYNVQSFIELHHAGVRQAGAGLVGTRSSAIVVTGPGLTAAPVAVLTTDHVSIDHPLGGGVLLDSMAAFTPDSTLLLVGGSQDYPIAVHLMAAGSIPFTEVQDDPAQSQHFDDALILDTSANVTADATITGNIPLRFETSVNVSQNVANPTPVTLTVEGGAVLRFKEGANLRMIFGNGGSGAVGRLVAVGDMDKPIVFTSASATPAAGDWAGLQLQAAPGSQLAYVTIEYAGGMSGVVSANCRPAGSADSAALIVADFPAPDLLTNSTIQFSAGHGIDATWASTTINGPDLTPGNTFNSVAGCKQTFNAKAGGSCPSTGCTVP